MRETTRTRSAYDKPIQDGADQLEKDADQMRDAAEEVGRSMGADAQDATQSRNYRRPDQRSDYPNDADSSRRHDMRKDGIQDQERWPVVNLATSFFQFSADLAAFGLEQMGVVARVMMGMHGDANKNGEHGMRGRAQGRREF